MDDVRDVDRLPPLPAPSCPVSCRQADSFFLLLFENYLGIRKPSVLRVLPSNLRVITYYFVGFGVTGSSRAYVGVRFSGFRVYEACVCSRAYLNPQNILPFEGLI